MMILNKMKISICLRRCCRILLLPVFLLSAFETGNAEVEQAQAKLTPWSGYWWPHYQGAILEPLTKYDLTTGKKSASWEQSTHPSGSEVPKWHGYCHAWAASAVMEQEPKKSRQVKGPAGSASLQVSDQKGWLAVSHARDIANFYGDRYGDGQGSEDSHDLAPDQLWRLLKLYVRQQEIPLILDVEAGDEVWNYPIYAYKIQYEPVSEGSDLYQAKLGLWMADDAVAPDFVGVKVRYQTYQFTFQMKNGSILMGSAKWTGDSLKDHPDFAWYPYVARPENPEIDYQLVQQMLGQSNPLESPTDGSTESPSEPNLVVNSNTAEPEILADSAESSTAYAEPMIPGGLQGVDLLSPIELATLVMNRTSAFNFDVSIDRFEGGIYRIGERFTISAKSEQPGYLYLLHIDPQGKLNLIYPLNGEDHRIPGGKLVQIPLKEKQKGFLVQGPPGQHRVTAVVTSRPLLFSGLINQRGSLQQHNQEQRKQNQAEEQHLNRKLEQVPGSESGQFRWHPTQRKLIEQLIRYYLQNGKSVRENNPAEMKQLLGKFAQDEVLYLVQ